AGSVVGGSEAERAGTALSRERHPGFGRQVAAMPVVAGAAALGLGELVAGGDLLRGAEALVHRALFYELLRGGPVLREPLTLEHGGAVPIEAQPVQGVLDPGDPLRS